MNQTSHIILCSTARLARNINLAHGQAQHALGKQQWQPLQVFTLNQWLSNVLDVALLNGDIDSKIEPSKDMPRGTLNPTQERVLWELAIESQLASNSSAANAMSELFDKAGMASAAMEANRLLLEWNLRLPAGEQTEETRQFLMWQAAFQKQCKQSGRLEAVRYFDWQVQCLQGGAGDLPAAIQYAGFDRVSPPEQRLFDVLKARGVQVEKYVTGLEGAATASHIVLTDQDAECRAAVAWAADKLVQNPQAKLAIIVPELAALRHKLAALLDDAMHPAFNTPLLAQSPRCYDFSLGLALNAQPVVATALNLLRFAFQNKTTQADFSTLLHTPYWSASESEADVRAQLDARMRENLPLDVRNARLLRFAIKAAETPVETESAFRRKPGLSLKHLIADLQALLNHDISSSKKQLPSNWVQEFTSLLEASHWPGERSLSSHEFQAVQAFNKALSAFAEFDSLLGIINVSQALRRLNQLCKEQIFQPESINDPRLQVMGMLEGAAAPLDAVWVMGMNDHVWPPSPRPNPLLPAALQRAAGTPNSDSAVQAEFALAIHQRLMHSAPQVIFSSAAKDNDRLLRTSPILAGIAAHTEPASLSMTLAEQLAVNAAKDLCFVDDHQAPSIAAGEHISGGTGLIKAQAICPAWAFYQYRLGARALKEPANGLEATERGTLVHAVLEHFWMMPELANGLADLQAMVPQELNALIVQAAATALTTFNAERDEALSPAFIALESQRLVKLVTGWLAFEATRPQPFRVTACEQEQKFTIQGIEIRLVIDRIDTLEDGGLVLMDYKTGASVDYKNWAEQRITEPQLPVYAAFVLIDDNIAAVCFAKVRGDDYGFSGVAADADIVPKVAALTDPKMRKVFSEQTLPDWQSLLAHWQTSINALALELKEGEAAVRFKDETQLNYCEVLPLLRLPERQLQFEAPEQGEP